MLTLAATVAVDAQGLMTGVGAALVVLFSVMALAALIALFRRVSGA